MEGPRPVTVDELPQIEELVNSVFRLPEGLAPIVFQLFPRLFAPGNLAHIRAVFDGECPVAVANYLLDWIVIDGCEILTASISTVATRPDHRNQGLSSLILDDCLGLMRKEGAKIVLVSGNRNLYRRLGCYPIGVTWVSRLRPEEFPPTGQTVMRIAEGPEAVPTLWGLHTAEDPRFKRTEGEFRAMFLAEPFGRAFGYRSHTWLVLHEGEAVAYAIVAVSESDQMQGRIVEWAGNRKALAGALGTIVARLGLENLEVSVPQGDQEFLDRLRLGGGDWQAQTMPGTVNLLDPVGLWQNLMPRHIRRLGEAGARQLAFSRNEEGAVTITLGQEALVFQDHERLARLIFGAGGHPWPDMPLPDGLQRTLGACLPLPFPWTQGLNYV